LRNTYSRIFNSDLSGYCFLLNSKRLQIATPNESPKEQIENPAINRVFVYQI